MKKYFLFFIGVALSYSLKGQSCGYNSPVYTPNNNFDVAAKVNCEENSFIERNSFDDYFFNIWKNVLSIEKMISTSDGTSSTSLFNCHGYTWVKTGWFRPSYGGPLSYGSDRWITESPLDFTNDSYYMQVSQPVVGAKVYWTIADHSAVVYAVSPSLIFVSKDAHGALFKHKYDEGPWAVSLNNVKFYVEKPEIKGNTYVCPNTTFEVTNAPVGFTWDSSSNLTRSGSGTSVTFSPQNSSINALGWVSIKNSAGVEVTRKDVWVGKPYVNNISGPSSVSVNSSYSFNVTTIQSALAAPTYYNWSVAGGSYALSVQGNNQVYITFYEATTYTIGVSIHNNCGAGTTSYVQVSAGRSTPSGIAYPNPVDNILFVDLDAFAAANPALSSSARISYDVRLYDGRGSLVRQQKAGSGIVEFDVSNLPNGTYYLHIYEGASSTPEMYQIIVQH